MFPDTVRLPVIVRFAAKVSSTSDLKYCVPSNPSNKSASRPEPAPSTDLIKVSKSFGSALNSTMDSTPPTSCLM